MFLAPKDFAKAIGIKDGTLRQHVKRKKVHRSGDYIDTEFELNKIYINDQTNGRGLDLSRIGTKENSKPVAVKKSVEPSRVIESPKIQEPSPPPRTRDLTSEETIRHSLDLRKKQADLEKAQKDNELKSLELAKKRGELIPVELMQKILTINIQSIFRNFEVESEKAASVFCDVLGGDREHLSEITKQLRENLQKTIDRTKVEAADEIKIAIKEYAEVRSRGERK